MTLLIKRFKEPPSSEDCSKCRLLDEDDTELAFAAWYPQMGGYVAKAVIVFSKREDLNETTCFDALIWHDGEFPFADGNPATLHHCDPDQFHKFGEQVAWMQRHEKAKRP